MKESDFMDILRRNDEDEIRKFIMLYGKKPKPFCPIYFFPSETVNDNSQSKGEQN